MPGDPPDILTILDKGQPVFVLTGGIVWDGKAERPFGEKEILVQDGKIAAIETRVAKPPGAQVIDLAGHTITPGFMDCHVHVTLDPDHSDLGTLAVTRMADIVAMPGDPFRDITVTGRVDFVMKEGRIYKEPD